QVGGGNNQAWREHRRNGRRRRLYPDAQSFRFPVDWEAVSASGSCMVEVGFLSNEQRAHLLALVRRPSERHGIARRANAMLLLDDGLSYEAVARVLYLDDDTVPGWRERFRREGLCALGLRLEGRQEQACARR